ncbi:endoplasmic reticulum-Golgi intermediate compartment protein 3-like [Dendrobium catenatum]|uniref:endoplasmic reticulum-Golgi intermediate compartment protein 3-like n=1 Tax=Dendrobium catenatum TaxID=906689 RepID=UPI0009F36011|nr:endoplasmic reticulum-Golgi intermediate compartment protein 3-like [Dendrobium catenatum]
MGCACDFALNGLNVPPKKKKRNFLSTEDFVCREIWICILGRLAGFRPNPALNPPKSAYQTAPKVNEDFYNRTLSGGLITIISSIAILLLFISEIRLYIYSGTETKLIVDTSRGERLRANFDVTFPSLACSLLSVDAMDISSERHFDIRHDIVKKRLDHLGKVIDSRKGDIGAPQVIFA